jgi:hypothetical protein
MKELATFIANYVVREANLRLGQGSITGRESRLVFLGPPLELMEMVFMGLVQPEVNEQLPENLPVLLQVPKSRLIGPNPAIGESGYCDHAYLLTVRGTASAPSFLALVSPDQHMDLSITSTSDVCGLGSGSSGGMTTFDDWWSDQFIQDVVNEGIKRLGLAAELEDARALIHIASRDAGKDDASRAGSWNVISRVFAASGYDDELTSSTLLAAACGVPPSSTGGLKPDIQKKALDYIAGALEDGFSAAIDRASQNAVDQDLRVAIKEFGEFIRRFCDIPTEFEDAPSTYYATSKGATFNTPPAWWTKLTAEIWAELLDAAGQDTTGIELEITNLLTPFSIGGLFLVRDAANLRIFSPNAHTSLPIELLCRIKGGTTGTTVSHLKVGSNPIVQSINIAAHKAPVRISVNHKGQLACSVKLLAISTWEPGIHVQSRTAQKLSHAKRNNRPGAGKPTIECAMVLEGAGRHLIDIFVNDFTQILPDAILYGQDEAIGYAEEIQCSVREVEHGHYNVEVECNSEGFLDLRIQNSAGKPGAFTICRVNLSCAEVRETGCNSEFERLLLENRGRRATVQVDRIQRISMLESWALDEASSAWSMRPVILGEDYGDVWSQPKWDSEYGPLFSSRRFISDPRPNKSEWNPPEALIDARQEIVRRIRGSENSNLAAHARFGFWQITDPSFRTLLLDYLNAYQEWFNSDPYTACWSDVVAVATTEPGTETLLPRLDAVMLSPLHPARLAWHCGAQLALTKTLELGMPCPAAALLDPDVVPDILELGVRGPDGIEPQTFISVECGSDYWSVLWNADSLPNLATRSKSAPFGPELGIMVGGLARGFSTSQVMKAFSDVADLLPAKPILSVGLSSSGTSVDSCNEGIAEWSRRRFGRELEADMRAYSPCPKILDIQDLRPAHARPDEPTLSNLVEDTDGALRWFFPIRRTKSLDLAVITQLDATQPKLYASPERSAISPGGLIRHRVRRQLPQAGQAYVVESRQPVAPDIIGDELLDKLSQVIVAIESTCKERLGFRFAPDTRAIKSALGDGGADFVAVSSSAVDPGCFTGEWLEGAYLWDYSLPSYSQRAGDTCGSYLISSIKEVDREALGNVISQLPGGNSINHQHLDDLLHEVARRGIPTVRDIAGEDTRAAGALGMFVAARVLQDAFRKEGLPTGLFPVQQTTDAGHPLVSLLVPVDPFKSYLDELAKSMRLSKDASLKRPDLLIATFCLDPVRPALKLVPVEVKYRSTGTLSGEESLSALSQAKAMSTLLTNAAAKGEESVIWKLAVNHLILSMISFGLRIYGQNKAIAAIGREWASVHEALAQALLSGSMDLQFDGIGRLVVIDSTAGSGPADRDGDGFSETIVISLADATKVMAGESELLYQAIHNSLGDWRAVPLYLTPHAKADGGKAVPDKPEFDSTNVSVMPDSALSLKNSDHKREKSDQEITVPQLTLPEVSTLNSGIKLQLGTTASRFEESSVGLNISDTRLNQLNMGVVGDLGTGKTQLLKSLITQVTSAQDGNRGIPPKFLILDYKKDYADAAFVEAVGARIVEPFRMPLNPFDTTGMVDSNVPWLDRFKFFADILDKIFRIGPVQTNKLKQAVKKAYEVGASTGRMPTIYDVHVEYKDILDGAIDSPFSIIDNMVDSEIFMKDPPAGSSFANFFDRSVVVRLASLDDKSKNMVVVTMLNMFYEHMLRIPKRPFIGDSPQLRAVDSYLLVDEADSIMQYEFDVLKKLLLQGREFGVGVILSSQYLSHFKVKSTDYRDPLLTWFIHKVPNVTASELSGLGLTGAVGELAERVKNLPNHHCLFKSYGGQTEIIRGMPFFELISKKADVTKS